MDKKCFDVMVIGAGASGMMAALIAAREGAKVLLLEQKERAGKKLLATGNGKCNYTNERMESSCFHGNKRLVETVLSRFGKEEAVSFFREIGIYPKVREGYYYPRSEQAVSVAAAFLAELKRQGVSFHPNTPVIGVKQEDGGWKVGVDHYEYFGKTVIFACGLLASPQFGSDGSCIPVLEGMGHHFTFMAPALCGFYGALKEKKGSITQRDEITSRVKGRNGEPDMAALAGVRVDAKVDLYIDGNWTASDLGQVQFVEYGLSGIPVFQVSRFASFALKAGKDVRFELTFLPDLTDEAVREELMRRYDRGRTETVHGGEQAGANHLRRDGKSGEEVPLSQMLNGLFPQKLIPLLLQKAGMEQKCTINELTEVQVMELAETIRHFKIQGIRPRDYEFAQVCAGGIESDEVDFTTLESRLKKGIYFCGEILDVDGICGGYNLQWAWSSGYVAGLCSARAARGIMCCDG